jgi:flagellar biosynthesis protein FlhB
MANDSSMQEKTEEPTLKKREDAHKEGKVPRSQEMTTAAMLLSSALIMSMMAPSMGAGLRDVFGAGLFLAGASPLDAPAAVGLLRDTAWRVLGILVPVLSALAGCTLVVTGLQARGVLSTKPIAPSFKKMNPLTNAKRMLGWQPWMELFKSLLKLTIVGIVIYFALSRAWPEIVTLAQQSPAAILHVAQRYAVRLLMTAGLAYLVLAASDYAYQMWQHEKQLKMTKQEVKEEHKQSEGDPMVKARMRSIGRQLARRQMFREVPTADVVITNPTHIAIALRYDPEQADAPVVVAMGQRKVAERIKQIARESGVPCMENRPLARALLASARVGTTIPAELYMAVAEVLAWVFKQRAARGNWQGTATA